MKSGTIPPPWSEFVGHVTSRREYDAAVEALQDWRERCAQQRRQADEQAEHDRQRWHQQYSRERSR
jgi:hypothetical protein